MKLFRERRDRFFDAMEDGVAIMPAGSPSVRNGDVENPFRAESDFHFLTGMDEPDAWAVLRKKGDERIFDVYLRPFDPEQEVWMGKRTGTDGAVGTYGADNGFDVGRFLEDLPAMLENQPTLYYAFGVNPENDTRILSVTNRLKQEARRGVSGPWKIVDPRTITWRMRLVKSKADIAAQQKACDVTAEAFKAAMRAVRPGIREYELAAVVGFEFARRGAKRLAFDTIAAAGANAATLHYTSNDAVIGEKDMVLVDAGAEVGMVCADITRTFPASGKFEPAARTVYQWVLDAHSAAVNAVKPGATYASVHRAGLEVLCRGLVDMKILSGDIDTIIDNGTYRPWFMHRIGHWLGLDCHDVGPYFVDGESITLEPGMVITIEPGLYFRKQPEVPARFRGIGVRIEDDVLVTPDGRKILTSAVPREVADIEAFMAGSPDWWAGLEPASSH